MRIYERNIILFSRNRKSGYVGQKKNWVLQFKNNELLESAENEGKNAFGSAHNHWMKPEKIRMIFN